MLVILVAKLHFPALPLIDHVIHCGVFYYLQCVSYCIDLEYTANKLSEKPHQLFSLYFCGFLHHFVILCIMHTLLLIWHDLIQTWGLHTPFRKSFYHKGNFPLYKRLFHGGCNYKGQNKEGFFYH